MVSVWCICSEGSATEAAPKKGSKAKPKDVQAERVQQRKSRKREKVRCHLSVLLSRAMYGYLDLAFNVYGAGSHLHICKLWLRS